MKKLLLSLFLLPLLASLGPQSRPVKPRLYVLSVGVRAYKDSNLNLNYADKDAREVAAAFQKQISLYDVREVKVLVNQEAGKNAIRTALRDFQTKVNADDLFLFFFSGHGLEDRLVPYDFSRDDAYGTSLLKEDLKALLEGMGCNYILLFDACHSGSLAKNITKSVTISEAQTDSRRLYEGLQSADKTQMILGSSASNQLSFECLLCQNGFFAEAILNVFANREVREASGITYRPDQDKDGLVSLYEFSSYMQDAVRIMTAEGRKSDSRIEVQKVYSKVQTSENLGFIQVGPVTLLDNISSTPPSPPLANPLSDILIPETEHVEGGAFIQGCTSEQGDCRDYAELKREYGKPTRRVSLGDFRIGKFEVTNEEFCSFLNEKGNLEEGGKKWLYTNLVTCPIQKDNQGIFVPEAGKEKQPVVLVSWYGARAYCVWLSKKTGKKYRLPSESEWEFAARGGNKSKGYRYAGSDQLDEVAWHSSDRGGRPNEVGAKKPNELGIYDMSGNVWEWVADCWNDSYLGAPDDGSAWGVGNCVKRVLRGGSWNYDYHTKSYRVGYRYGDITTSQKEYYGLRVVQDY